MHMPSRFCVRGKQPRPIHILAGFVMLLVILSSTPGYAIPAFARKYGLPCSACHEAWPKLNSFGQNFKDQGYQLNNDRDSPIWLNPSYWPVAMRITPHWHYESAGRQLVDSGDGLVEQTIKTSGFDLTGIDILAAGTLAKNVSFLLVPSIDPGDGTTGFESANVRFDDIKGSPWLNFKFGKYELDTPLTEKRIMTLSNNGGFYQLWHYIPLAVGPDGTQDINDFTVGENQLGIELMGHSLDDHSRYAASLISSTNGNLGLPGGRSYDGFLHLSQGFMAGKLGLQRVGVYGISGLRPTFSLTQDGVPIPGTGRGNRSFYRAGAYGNLYIGKFDLTGVYQHASDNVFLANGTPANGTLPDGAQGATWNIGTFEGHYVYSPKHFILGRYELVRMSRQPLRDIPNDFGNVDVFTAGYRFYPFINSRAGFAWHIEFSTLNLVKTADSGADQRSNSFFTGFDFAF